MSRWPVRGPCARGSGSPLELPLGSHDADQVVRHEHHQQGREHQYQHGALLWLGRGVQVEVDLVADHLGPWRPGQHVVGVVVAEHREGDDYPGAQHPGA